MKTYLLLASVELNINDEYTRHVDNVLVQTIKAERKDEAQTQVKHQIGDSIDDSRIEYLELREV
jgi:hypothetical protein